MWQQLLKQVSSGNIKALARSISFVENEYEGHQDFLAQLTINNDCKITGITGPPGAGKSTLVDALIGEMIANGKRLAVLCVDPSSPFNLGAILGDRIRMSRWYNEPQVFIRSLATRGAMGGLHPKILEITEILKAAGFDHVIVETVGVGQSEIEIAGLADTTVVVVVPEAGDEVQTMKAGLMEIADIFVVNKSDRPGADSFVKNLHLMLAPAFSNHSVEIPVIKTVASKQEGIDKLYAAIQDHQAATTVTEKKLWLLTERIYQLIQQERMKDINKQDLKNKITSLSDKETVSLYSILGSLGFKQTL